MESTLVCYLPLSQFQGVFVELQCATCTAGGGLKGLTVAARMLCVLLMFADDHNRVVLKTLPGQEHSDYINASHVDVMTRA